MSFLFPHPSAPTPPPPPPAPANPAQSSIMEQGAAQRQRLSSAEGQGTDGTDVTGGQGAAAPATTKTLLGG